MERLYLFLFVCLGVFGCMATGLNSLGPAGPEVAQMAGSSDRVIVAEGPSSPGHASAGGLARLGSGNGVVLDRRSDGHFYANVEINGATIEMLVDTGASGIALSANDARRAGIATSIGMREHVGEGAGGAVYGDVVQIDRIRLGDVEVNGVPGVVLKGGSMSLLGQSFLAKFGKVEIAGDRMILRS